MARPTKLTPDIQAAIVDAILHGASYKDAAESAGVSYSTFNVWMKAGENAKNGKFVKFLEAVRQADAECARNMVRVIQSAAAKGDWKAALEWLKRRRRADWGDGVDVTSGGEKIEIGIKYIDYRTNIATPETGPSGDSEASSED